VEGRNIPVLSLRDAHFVLHEDAFSFGINTDNWMLKLSNQALNLVKGPAVKAIELSLNLGFK
jgi:hypothetical protein